MQVVKSWARARGIKDAFEGTLNSMGHTLLLLYFLAKQRAIPDLFAPHITLVNHQRRKKEDKPSGRSGGGEEDEGVGEARGAAGTALKGCRVTARVRMQVIRSDGGLQHLALHLDLDGAGTAALCACCCRVLQQESEVGLGSVEGLWELVESSCDSAPSTPRPPSLSLSLPSMHELTGACVRRRRQRVVRVVS